MESQLFGIGALDALTIAVASALLAVLAVSAAISARRAALVKPSEALRFE